MTPTSPVTLSREELRARIESLRDHAQRQGTWGIEYGDDRFMADVLALVDASRAVTETPEGLDAALARLMHGFAHSGYGPWDQSGGQRHRESDIAIARPFANFITEQLARKEEHGG